MTQLALARRTAVLCLVAAIGCRSSGPDAQPQDLSFFEDLPTSQVQTVGERRGLLSLTSDGATLGETINYTVTGADPGEQVTVVRSTGGEGDGPCIAALGGLCLSVRTPVVRVGNGLADAAGTAVVSMTIPATAPAGGELSAQAVIKRGPGGVDSISSNPITDTLMEPAPDDSGLMPWEHTITIDGDASDFDPATELFGTTSGSKTPTYITWDADNLYVASTHPDVASGGGEHWVVITLGNGGAGTTTGAAFNTQEPGLPFEATHVVRWKANNSYNSLLTWDGLAFVETPGWLGMDGSAHAEDEALSTVEFQIPLASIGAFDVVNVHVNWLFEGAGFESTFNGTPETSFTDGYDPDYRSYYSFDLTSPTPPSSYPIISPPYRSTIAVDGDASDFSSAFERFDNASGGDTFVTWDDSFLYVGVVHPDVQFGGADHAVLITVGGDGTSSTTGPEYGTQEPELAFAATDVFSWTADDASNERRTFDGVDWVSTPGWFGTAGSAVAENNDNQTVEFAIPFSEIGVTGTFRLHVNWVFMGPGSESSYAAVPSTSFSDGTYDPDHTAYYEFDLASASAPGEYPVLP